MIFLALKTYKQTTGEEAIKILSSVKTVAKETKIPIIAVAQATDIYRIKKELGIEVWGQHSDAIDPGKNTGWISPYSLKEAGATGVLINHSEHKMDREEVIERVVKAKEYGLKTMVIGQSPETVMDFDNLNTDYVAYEEADLISGKVSMIDKQGEAVRDLVLKMRHPLIIGAGIADGEDVRKTVEAGAQGILMATYFINAENHEEKLRELAKGFKD